MKQIKIIKKTNIPLRLGAVEIFEVWINFGHFSFLVNFFLYKSISKYDVGFTKISKYIL